VSGARILNAENGLILASSSPRRRSLLESLGIRFEVRPADVDETPPPGADPAQAAVAIAVRKVRAVAEGAVAETGVVIGADTLVVVDGTCLGKPRDAADAEAMLRRLRGREHHVVTGVAVLRLADGAVFSDAARTMVAFEAFDDATLAALVATGDHEGKAGAYAIQGMAGPLVKRLDGDYFNVVGLPLNLLRRLLREAGAV